MAALMAAIAEAESGGNPRAHNASGASGLWQILGLPFPGNVYDPLTNAKMALAKFRSQGLGAWTTYTSGAYKQFLGGAGGIAGLANMISAPHITGAGGITDMAQAAVNKMAAAANTYLTGASGGAAGGGAGGGGTSTAGGTLVPSTPWNPDRKPIASWIVPVLDWASKNGWHGFVTSGYRTPSEQMAAAQQYAARVGQPVSSLYAGGNPLNSNHLKTAYPGGAVDVDGGSDAQLLNVLRGYKGLDTLTGGDLGPGDPFHFSHDGFALGGLIRSMAGGGMAEAASMKVVKPPKTPKPKHPKGPGHSKSTGMSVEDLRELATLGGRLNSLEQNATLILGGSSGEGEYSAESARFAAQEGQPRYQNPDGSMNAAGYAKMAADDEQLLRLQQQALADYKGELTIVGPALRKWLGKQSVDFRDLQRNTAKISRNKLREISIRKAISDLSKPSANQVQALDDQIAGETLKYGGAVTAAEHAKAKYRGADTGTKDALDAAVTRAEANEQAALEPLKAAKLAATVAQQARAQRIKVEKFNLSQQLKGLLDQNIKLGIDDTKLRGFLSGANGGQSTDKTVSLIESIAGQLGIVEWGSGGAFKGINTSNQGAIYDTQTTILGLQNSIHQATADEGTAGNAASDNTQLITLLEQQNANLAEQLAVNQTQTAVMTGLLPSIPHFDTGGPVLEDTLAMVHKDEHVVPKNGALVLRGGSSSGPAVTHVQMDQHFHGALAGLMQLVDQRIQHPDNVRMISRQIGQRTQLLSHSARR
jgi:Transglycosylase SLT domain